MRWLHLADTTWVVASYAEVQPAVEYKPLVVFQNTTTGRVSFRVPAAVKP